MHIKCIVSPLGLVSQVAEQQEQLQSNPWQELPNSSPLHMGYFLGPSQNTCYLKGRHFRPRQTGGLWDLSKW